MASKKSRHHNIYSEMRRSRERFQMPSTGGQPSGLRMNRDVIIEDGAIARANRIDSLYLECVALQIFHCATQDVVGFALELGRRMRGALLGRKQIRVKPIRASLVFGILVHQLNIGGGKRDRRRLI